jgi:O-methyltransferase involved in polyketide biosynthesis
MTENIPETAPEGVDLERPNAARVYDHILGGTANWAIDREFGDRLVKALPIAKGMAHVNREFLGRAVQHCVRNGVTQFLDIGSGIPTVGNVHEVADELDPQSRCVYVDYEAVAVAHSQILLETHGDLQRHAVVRAKMQSVEEVWHKALATGVLDPDKPIALIMVALLHFVVEEPEAHVAVDQYRALLPPGSRLVISHGSDDGLPDTLRTQFQKFLQLYDNSSTAARSRDRTDIQSFFGDFDIVSPGLVWLPDWHLDERPSPYTTGRFLDDPRNSCVIGGVGVKR